MHLSGGSGSDKKREKECGVQNDMASNAGDQRGGDVTLQSIANLVENWRLTASPYCQRRV